MPQTAEEFLRERGLLTPSQQTSSKKGEIEFPEPRKKLKERSKLKVSPEEFLQELESRQREEVAGFPIFPGRKSLGLPETTVESSSSLSIPQIPFPEEDIQIGDITKFATAAIEPALSVPPLALGPKGIPLSVGGSIAGSIIQNRLQKRFSEFAGEPGSLQILKQFGIEPTGNPDVDLALEAIAMNAASGGIGKVGNLLRGSGRSLKQTLANKLTGESGRFSPPARESFEQLERLGLEEPPITAGSKGGPAKFFEDALTPGLKRTIIKRRNEVLKKNFEKSANLTFERLPGTEATADINLFKTSTAFREIKDSENAAFKFFRQSTPTENVEVITGLNKTAVFPIKAPITYNNTKKLAEEIKSSVNTALGEVEQKIATGETFSAGEELIATRTRLSKLRDIVETYSSDIQTLKNGKVVPRNIVEFDKIQADRETINRFIPKARSLTPEQGQIKRLASAMTEDIKTSVESFGGGSSKLLKDANTITREKKRLFTDEFFEALSGDNKKLLNAALEDVNSAQQWLEAAGHTNRKELQTELLAEFFEKHMKFDPEIGDTVLDISAALDSWNSRNFRGLTEVILTGKTKARIKNLLRVSAEVSPRLSMSGRVALGFAEGRAAVNVVRGSLVAVGGTAGGFSLASTLGGTLGAGVGIIGLSFSLREFTKHVLLNPKIAGIATGLVGTSVKGAGSSKVRRDTIKILTALKGTRAIIYQYDNEGNRQEIGTFTIPQNVDKNLSGLTDSLRMAREL